MDTPDITPIQKLSAAGLGLLTAILVLVNAMGWSEIDTIEAGAITGVYVAFAGFAMAADAIIRKGRAQNYAEIVSTPPPPTVEVTQISAAHEHA